jgi:hypothetical protein
VDFFSVFFCFLYLFGVSCSLSEAKKAKKGKKGVLCRHVFISGYISISISISICIFICRYLLVGLVGWPGEEVIEDVKESHVRELLEEGCL